METEPYGSDERANAGRAIQQTIRANEDSTAIVKMPMSDAQPIFGGGHGGSSDIIGSRSETVGTESPANGSAASNAGHAGMIAGASVIQNTFCP